MRSAAPTRISCLLGSVVGALVLSGAASSHRAATSEQVTIVGPVSGSVSSSPLEARPHHRPYGGDWSADVATGGAARTVYARFTNATGSLRLRIVDDRDACRAPNAGTAGRRLTVEVRVDNAVVGTVVYSHLRQLERSSGVIANGDALGVVATTAHSGVRGTSCWSGPHLHVEPRNTSGYSCFRATSLSLRAAVSTTTVLGVLGGRYATGANQRCPLPNTTIVSGPSSPTRATSASFRFESSQPSSRFECRLDGSPWSRCASPRSYTGIREGRHTFSVRATSDIGTDTSPATKTWQVDSTPLDCNVTQTRSIAGVTPTEITFRNASAVTIDVYWLNYVGERVFYWTLAPGQSYLQRTWLTHPWVAVDRSGVCHGYTISDVPSKTYVIP